MRILFLLAPLLFLTACGPEVIYEKETVLPETGWSYADSTTFTYAVANTEQAYDLMLDLRHGVDFPYQNFYVKFHATFPSGKSQTEQLSLQLAGDYGIWRGDCSGESCSLSIPFMENTRYAQAGEYTITFVQHSRDEPLPSLQGIGFRVLVHEE